MEKEQNLFQQIFRSELTWLGLVVVALWGVVVQVILPIQKISIEVDQLTASISQVQTYDARITQNANDIIQLKDEFSSLTKK